MLRICALAMASITALAMTVGAEMAMAASMAPSTGEVSGDWDVDTNAMNAAPRPAATLGGEFFHVTWSATENGRGQPSINGYVYDDYGEPATHVQLQISALDATGAVRETVVTPVRGTIPAEGNAYFDVSVPQSPSYRVTVLSFEFVEPAKGK
jgi:hypothetical protein